MNHKQTLKTFNEWRKGADIEQPNPADIGVAIDGVLSELDELRAKVEALESIVNGTAPLATSTLSDYRPEVSIHLEQSLADIKAQTVTQFTEHVKYTFEGIMSDNALIDFGSEYIANKLKGGE